MIPEYKMRLNAAFAVSSGLGLRLFFVLKFPVTNTGDSPFYIEMAWNWLKNHVYGLSIDGVLTPVDMRVPGYPSFLAAVFAVAGQSQRAVMLAQAVVDLGTCVLIALIAARIAGPEARQRVAIAALWLAALCPFTANYTAVVLSETLATFLTALAILLVLNAAWPVAGTGAKIGAPGSGSAKDWLLAGVVSGFGALVRPETPLVLIAAGALIVVRWRHPPDWGKLMRATVFMGVGVILPLVPWAARNWRTLHDVQFLAPRYSELPGEYTPVGFTAWSDTWMWRMRDVYLSTWNVNEAAISLDDLPSSAFDSAAERARVGELLREHNERLAMSPEIDRQFAEIARERTARDPLRTYLKIPTLRGLAMWFTPRVELLPVSGNLWPWWQEWDEDRVDVVTTLFFGAVNLSFVLIAIVGAWRSRHRPGVSFLVLFIAIRTIFFAYFADTSEPRYVLECFPALIALGAQFFGQAALRRPAIQKLDSTY